MNSAPGFAVIALERWEGGLRELWPDVLEPDLMESVIKAAHVVGFAENLQPYLESCLEEIDAEVEGAEQVVVRLLEGVTSAEGRSYCEANGWGVIAESGPEGEVVLLCDKGRGRG